MPMMLLLDTAAIRLALAAMMMLVNTLEFYFHKNLDMEKSADYDLITDHFSPYIPILI